MYDFWTLFSERKMKMGVFRQKRVRRRGRIQVSSSRFKVSSFRFKVPRFKGFY